MIWPVLVDRVALLDRNHRELVTHPDTGGETKRSAIEANAVSFGMGLRATATLSVGRR